MYDKLPLQFIGITEQFGSRKDPITGQDSFHYGIDLGWHSFPGEPIYAIHDAKVVYEGYDDNLGNNVALSYNDLDKTIIYRYFHMKDRSLIKQGKTVKRGDTVGYMGATGYATGVHLHFEYWICPKDYSFNYNDRPKYAVNPLDYCFLFDDQTISVNDYDKIIKVVGTKLNKSKDEMYDQVKVIGKYLRCRENPSLNGKILGYIDYGIYNILEKAEKDNYTWYKLKENMWIANVLEDVETFNKKTVSEDLLKYKKFTASKEGYYYIKLKENETIYFE